MTHAVAARSAVPRLGFVLVMVLAILALLLVMVLAISTMVHVETRSGAAGTQEAIKEACARPGAACGVEVVPVGTVFAATRGVELPASSHTPNNLGIQLISETLRRHLRLV